MNQALSNILVAVATAFIVSAGSTVAMGWKDQAVDQVGLRANTEAVKELTSAVRELQINQAVFNERYVTKSELESKLKENR